MPLTAAPELTLVGKNGTKVATLSRDSATGLWRARVDPAFQEDRRRAEVVARWGAAEIGHAEHEVVVPRASRPLLIADAVALASPVGQVGAEIDYAALPAAAMAQGFVFAVRVQPELVAADMAELGTDLAFATEIPILRRLAFYGTLAGRDLSELPLTLGLRGQLLGTGRFSLGVAGDLTMSSLDGAPTLHARALVLAELGVGPLRLQGVGAVVGGDGDRGGSLGAQGTLLAGVRVGRRVGLVGGGEVLVAEDVSALAVAAGVRFRLSLFELQLALRKGLGADGEALWSPLAGVFSLEYRTGGRW